MIRTVRCFLLYTALLVAAGCDTTPSAWSMEEAAAGRSSFAGSRAPQFTLPDENEQPVSLSDYRGQWVVLYFYPADDTPGCACQATEFTAILQKFHEQDAVVIGVSPDSPESHRLFAEKYDLKIKLLSDVDQKVMQRYGAWVDKQFGDQTHGSVVRSTVLISPDGKVAYHWPEVIPKGHAERVREKLAALKAARAGS